VGWLFWLVTFAVALGPCIGVAWITSLERALPSTKVAIGVVIAALVSGFFAWGVNAFLQRREAKRRMQERKLRRRKQN